MALYAFYGVFLQRWQLKLPLFSMLYLQITFAVLMHIPLLMYTGLDMLNAANPFLQLLFFRMEVPAQFAWLPPILLFVMLKPPPSFSSLIT